MAEHPFFCLDTSGEITSAIRVSMIPYQGKRISSIPIQENNNLVRGNKNQSWQQMLISSALVSEAVFGEKGRL